jgi:FkbM family methyltransferase
MERTPSTRLPTSSRNFAPMMSFARIVLSSIRFAARVWPFPFGQDMPARIGAFATKVGLLSSEWYEFQPGLWMQLNARDLIQQTILLDGVWDPSLTSYIEKHLRPGDVFVDVGAHVGYFTLLASRRVGPTGAVLSIEPNPFALKQLAQNVERSQLQNVLVEHTACGETRNVVQLYLHTESNSSKASLYPGDVTGDVAVEVPCTTLDHLCQERSLQRVKLVKIDVEGAELFVLRGMKRIMREMRPVIVLELHPHLLEAVGTPLHGVLAFLREFDYVLEPLGGHSNYVCRSRVSGD